MNQIKYLVIYMDNSCEVHFSSSENARIIISPCGSEFVYRIYASDNTISSTFKYRTAYPISMFTNTLATVLSVRNRFCDNGAFVSPLLLESTSTDGAPKSWLSTENLNEMRWRASDPTNNPIKVDFHNFFFVWRSECNSTEFKLHFNKATVVVKYPIRVPSSADDEFEQKCNLSSLAMRKVSCKNLVKYTWNEEELSARHLPPIWSELYAAMLKLVNRLSTNDGNEFARATSQPPSPQDSLAMREDIVVKLPQALPLSCSSTHLHKFDCIETFSEPKVIYMNQTWYKLFYKTKSIEICCPPTVNDPKRDAETVVNPEDQETCGVLDCTQDFLISDSFSGRYYTCYSLKRRSNVWKSQGQIEEHKICVENIPSFRALLKNTLNYSNILLKRICSLRCISNYSTCYLNKKLEEMCPIVGDKQKEYSQCIQRGDASANYSHPDDRTKSSVTNVGNEALCSTTPSQVADNYVHSKIRKQYFIEHVGHFKYQETNAIVINFVDKVKLYMDNQSLQVYLQDRPDQTFCHIYLPDNSQHEICFLEKDNANNIFAKYLSYLEQWLNWLRQNKLFPDHKQACSVSGGEDEKLNLKSMQKHLSQLKLFNYTISDEINHDARDNSYQSDGDSNCLMPVNKILQENSQFLKNISK